MSLFNQILNAIDNPDQLANAGQIANIMGTVHQLSNNSEADTSTIQTLMSLVGKYARPALQAKRDNEGEEQTRSFVNQFSGTQPSNQAVNLLFSSPQVQQLIEEAEQRTGLAAGTIQNLLPTLVPLVLNLLQTGASSDNPQGSNSVLNSFLDSDGDGDVDITDAMKMARRFLNP